MARPSDYTDELVTEICRRIADGSSLRKVCQADDMPDVSTVIRWLAKATNVEFRAQYARARELQADTLFDQCLEIADDATNDTKLVETGDTAIEVVNHEHIQRSRLRVDTRKWMAGRLAPKKYGDKVELSGSGPGGAIQVQAVTPAQVQDDLSHIFGAAAVGSIAGAAPEPVQPAEAAPGAPAGDPVVPEGADGGGSEVTGAPAPSQAVAEPERPVLLIDDDMPAEGP